MGQSAPTPSVERVRKSSGAKRGITPSQGSVPPPTPTPILGAMPSRPAKTRGSVHMIFPALASVLEKSRAASKRLPASSTVILKPRAASSLAMSEPHGPAPTITASGGTTFMTWVHGLPGGDGDESVHSKGGEFGR